MSTQSVRIKEDILKKVRKRAKQQGLPVGTVLGWAAEQWVEPEYEAPVNSDMFEKFLTGKGIKWKNNGSFTTVYGVTNPIGLGMEWGRYEALNNPANKK